MSLQQWQTWPLGPIPLLMTLWGVYWLVGIYQRPNKPWLQYEDRNSFALYAVAATLALSIAYSFRRVSGAPTYLFHANWLPLLSFAIATLLAEIIERILKIQLGYKPVVEQFRRRNTRNRKTLTASQVRIQQLAWIIVPAVVIGLSVALPDTDNSEEHLSYWYVLKLLLGNVHMQAGMTWGFTALVAMLIRGGNSMHFGHQTE